MSHSQKVRVAPCTVLIVDDERNIRNTLSMCLEAMGCHVLTASNGDEAIQHAQKSLVDVAFLDLRLAHEDGLQLLPRLLAERPALQVVVVTAFATLDTAVEAMRRGAQDYLPKPFTPDQVRHVLHLLQERSSLRRRVTELEDELQRTVPNVEMQVRSRSARMQHVLGVLERAAPSDACIMLKGESGTGKSLLARVVHEKSARATRPFVTVNCPTLTEDLLASELFGHARGSFTGALKDQPGRVESADGGTLFLDEIGELPGSLQAKLLRFVQDKEFERVGENRTRRADVRVLAATNRNLEADVRSGRFREDLYYRLNVVEVTVPALRERQEDVEDLARGFVAFFAAAAKKKVPTLDPAALDMLLNHAWPGNIRELRNAIERAVVLLQGSVIGPLDLPERMVGSAGAPPAVGGNHTLEKLQEAHIKAVVDRSATLEEAARTLGIDASTLWRRRKKQ